MATGHHPTVAIREGVSALELCVNQQNLTNMFAISVEFSKGNNLDLIFSNIGDIHFEECLDPIIDNSLYHRAINSFRPIEYLSKNKCEQIYFDYGKANYDGIEKELSEIKWEEFFNDDSDIDTDIEKYYKFIFELVSCHVPSCRKFDSSFPPCFTSKIRKEVFLKKKLHAKIKETWLDVDYHKFQNQRRKCKFLIAQSFKEYSARIESHIKKDARLF
ncbi:hypothetical protein QAD02_021285 [Eretmocerus hayati]|uniref:Uncharacterized protein n=1 Tax=Eretmocerus hayati TaxID=131215 RepID=A0ACC2PQ09_9HYME|nr:hypothetical protein QAD02_021285 [Eretmocerus hayati]